jgi:glycerol-3-phosphate acyltransferase PlsY
MVKITDFSLHNMMKEYNENKTFINNYIKVKQGHTIEGYKEDGGKGVVAGLGVGLFLIIFIIIVGISIWAIVALIKYSPGMPIWAIILSIALLFFGGAFFSLITVYVTKDMGRNNKIGI